MSDEEVDELLKAVDTSSGEINYTGAFTLFGLRRASLTNSTFNATDLVRTILAN